MLKPHSCCTSCLALQQYNCSKSACAEACSCSTCWIIAETSIEALEKGREPLTKGHCKETAKAGVKIPPVGHALTLLVKKDALKVLGNILTRATLVLSALAQHPLLLLLPHCMPLLLRELVLEIMLFGTK